MIAVINRLPVKEGMTDQVVERFADGRGFVQDFPGFVSMEVLRSEEANEVLVITRWLDKEGFNSCVHSDEFRMAHGRSGGSGLLREHPAAARRTRDGKPALIHKGTSYNSDLMRWRLTEIASSYFISFFIYFFYIFAL